MIKHQTKHVAILAAVALLLVALLACSFERDVSVDVNLGRIQTSAMLFGVRFGARSRETWLSRNATSSIGPPDWKVVRCSSLFSAYSPHFLYHGAEAQISQLEFLCEHALRLTADGKQYLADSLLRHWQSGSDRSGDMYIALLSERLQKNVSEKSKLHSALTLKGLMKR